MTTRLPLLLAAPLIPALLGGCASRADHDLTSQVLFTASGSFDAQADTRRREGGGVRSVQWTRRPPVQAARVTVRYDTEQRPQSWLMTLQEPGFKATELNGKQRGQVRQVQGQRLTVYNSGPLRDVLLLDQNPQEWTLLTRAYAQHHLPQYLAAFSALEPQTP